jgi:hypothetical protein
VSTYTFASMEERFPGYDNPISAGDSKSLPTHCAHCGVPFPVPTVERRVCTGCEGAWSSGQAGIVIEVPHGRIPAAG